MILLFDLQTCDFILENTYPCRFQHAPVTTSTNYRQLCAGCGTDPTYTCLYVSARWYELSVFLAKRIFSVIITGYGTWCFQYVPESKRPNFHWKQTSPRPKQLEYRNHKWRHAHHFIGYQVYCSLWIYSTKPESELYKYWNGNLKLFIGKCPIFGPTIGFSTMTMP
jgi:hypothetical protein